MLQRRLARRFHGRALSPPHTHSELRPVDLTASSSTGGSDNADAHA
jgi:hypothetical protein